MPDAFVFPGGAVDETDRTLAIRASLPDVGAAPAAVAVAALRELFEEAGILLARDVRGAPVDPEAASLAAFRAEIAAHASFAASLDRRGLVLDVASLAHYSNWITPASEPIRFDAHFFIARAPANQSAAADATEVHDGVWLDPADALAAAERGDMTIPFPTRRHLGRLASFGDVDALLAHARARQVVPVLPVAGPDGTFAFDDAW